MKNIIIALSIVLSQFGVFAQQKTYKQHGIKKVQTKITNTRKPDRSFVLNQTYDKKGNLLDELKTDSNGQIVEHLIYHYEDNKKTIIKKDNLGNEIFRETIIKNKDGKTIETTSENLLKQQKEGRKYVYDKWGNLTSEIWIDNKDEIERTKQYFYNEEGMLIQQISLDEKGEIIFQKDITYAK